MNTQLPLGLKLEVGFTFDNFHISPENSKTRLARDSLVQLAAEEIRHPQMPVFLWGQSGSGKTHLLQACCQQAADHELTLAYLPLDQLLATGSGVLESFEQQTLICIDQLDAVQGKPEWEGALFTLFNRTVESGGRLVVAGHNPPSAMARRDLATRLAWGITVELLPPADDQKAGILQQRATTLGLQLSDEAAAYLLQRAPRDMHNLMQLLDHLDHASLATQRRLSVPLIREVLAAAPEISGG
ncbi:MAG: DnaA regulatory inactivator Hda [Gammaproteobacteria bacterium]|nr:DnaA regulatory inactivator Hda [Gammaproteobacteria bacterium]